MVQKEKPTKKNPEMSPFLMFKATMKQQLEKYIY